jgi:hypothetical protein
MLCPSARWTAGAKNRSGVNANPLPIAPDDETAFKKRGMYRSWCKTVIPITRHTITSNPAIFRLLSQFSYFLYRDTMTNPPNARAMINTSGVNPARVGTVAGPPPGMNVAGTCTTWFAGTSTEVE